MDTDSSKSTKSAGGVSSSSKSSTRSTGTPAVSSSRTTSGTATLARTRATAGARSSTSGMSAEDKLKKSIKNLSYTSTGMSSASVTKQKSTGSKATARKKVGGVVLDVETIQGTTKQKFETRGRRNNVIILVLSLLLVVSLVYLTITVIGYRKNKVAPNCKYLVSGDAQAEWIIEGGSKTAFHLPKDLVSNSVYVVNSKLKIKSSENVRISIEIKVLLDGEEVLIAGLYFKNPDQDISDKYTRTENTNIFVYQDVVEGGTTINLFDGINFAEEPHNVNSKNTTIQVTANVTKV